MANGDVYELVDHQEFLGQTCLNVYFYDEIDDAGGSTNKAQSLIEAFISDVLPSITPIQSELLTHTRITARNLFDDTEAWEELISVPGEAGTPENQDAQPPFSAFAFKIVTDNASVRPGGKRYAGMLDSTQDDGIIVDASYPAALDTLADAVKSGIEVGLGALVDVFLPVVVKRVRSGVPGAYEYRLPENSGESVIGLVVDALWDIFVSHQNSRSYGIGV